jgi:hypothetical protein
VKSTGVIEVEAMEYACPATHMGRVVQVQHDAAHVRIIDNDTGRLLIEHQRQRRQSAQGSPPEASRVVVVSPTVELVKLARRHGEHIGIVSAAVATNDHEEYAVRRIKALLAQVHRHGVGHIETACRVAVAAGAPTYRCVRAWLDHHPPAPLAQVDPLIRNLIAYRDVVTRNIEQTDLKETA